jgi:hypothetical protein
VPSAFSETDLCTGNQILHGSSNEALAWPCKRYDPGSNMHCDTTHVVLAHLDLTGVKARANFDS